MIAVKLGEICELHYGKSLSGYHDNRPDEAPVRVFGTNGPIGWTKEPLVEKPTIVIGRKGAYRGVHLSWGPSWTIDTAYFLTVRSPRIDLKWLYYRLLLLDINRMDTGAAIPSTKREDFYAATIKVLSPGSQSRVVDVLSAYDDLIETNLRRIRLLVQSVQLLYKEWFVRHRFPGHENTKIIDGVPEGWSRSSLRDITTKIGSGATPRGGAASYKTEGITLIRSQHVYDYQFDEDGLAFIDEEQAARLDNVIVEPRDILLNITGASVARCCMVPSRYLPARVNQHVMIVRVDPDECSPHYILGTINSYREKQHLLNIARAGGATREALTKDTVCNMAYAIPPKRLLTEFDAVAEDLFKQQECLSDQNAKLAKARDLLLPRLMSGEIPA